MFGFGKKNKPEPPHLEAVFACETGLLRPDNQDNVFLSVDRGVFCVADGVGGGAEGAKASASVCHELNLMTQGVGDDFNQRIQAVRTGLIDANTAIYTYAKERGYETMGSTAAVLLFDAENRSRAAVMHVGDSRVYRVRHGLYECITRDHRIYGGSTLTRAIGARPTLACDVEAIGVAPGDRFLVCTDGVTSVVSDARLAVFVGAGAIESAAERLAGEIVRHGAPDNYSFIIVSA